MRYNLVKIIGVLACLLLIGACFLPWVHYNSINETFNGFNVHPFSTGNNYGKAGKVIAPIAGLLFFLMIIPRLWAKWVGLFLAAILFSFTIRTFIIFTGSLFEGDVVRYSGIYLINIFSFCILLSFIFSNNYEKNID